MKKLNASNLLNKSGHHSIAAVSLNIDIINYGKNKGKQYETFGNLHISDCTKSISLSLDFDNYSSYKNTLYKLKTLRKIIEKAEENIEYAYNFNKNGTKT